MPQTPTPQNVLYLPPGASPPPPPTPGIPFDRTFFERVLPQAVSAFAGQVSCGTPIVEITTVDGVVHYVHGISGIADTWVALHVVHKDDDTPGQIFISYQTIFRVEIDPCSDTRPRRLGFALDAIELADDEDTPQLIGD